MKLLVAFLLVALAGAQIAEKRNSSLAVLTTLQRALPKFIGARDLIDHDVSEALLNASDILKRFLLDAFAIQDNSLHSVLNVEAETLTYFGPNIDNWCWESNVPMLDGIMRWIGMDHSECIMQLDKSLTKIILNVYDDFQKKQNDITYGYTIFSAFHKRNIFNNPQSIIDAISETVLKLSDAIPNFDSTIANFEQNLKKTLPEYSECLSRRLTPRIDQIVSLKQDTMRCVNESKMS